MNPEIVPVDNESRKELLMQQFDEAPEVPLAEQSAPVATPEVAKPEVAANEQNREIDGKYAPGKTKPVPESVDEPVWKRPPGTWKKEFHETWKTADPRFQEYAYQREEQMRAGVEPLISKAHFADSINTVVEPYMQTIRGLGIDVPTAVKGLMEADNILRNSNPQEKAQYFSRLAQQYGIDLGGVSQYAPQGAVDPNVYALQNELNKVRGEVNGWKQQQEEAQNQVLLNDIAKFATAKEHFEDARPTMISLLQSGVATTLEDAYDKAIRLDDKLFQSTQQAQQAQQVSSRRVTADRAAKAARAAAVSVRSSTPGSNTTTKAQDRRSLLSEQFDSMNERI